MLAHGDLSHVSTHLHERELTVLLDVEPGLVDDDAAVGGEDLHGDPQRPDEDEEPDGEAARRHQQRPLVQVEAETAPPKHRDSQRLPLLPLQIRCSLVCNPLVVYT